MPGDALWALAACLLIEAFLAPVARIVCCLRYRIQIEQPPRNADSESGGTDAAKQKGGELNG